MRSERKTADLSTALRSGRDDKFVAREFPIIQWMRARLWLNKFVISTGAQRSGEICGFAFASHAPTL
ncbi:MAG TPA: hypothetical protein VFE27_19250 [Acidobacteriaceae bacterium]|nr:hypothetical protein [Acidobacteriaceae bacterium]